MGATKELVLNKRQMEALRLSMEGKNQREIVEKTGMSLGSVNRLLNREDVIEYRAALVKKILATRLSDAMVKSANVLIGQLEHDNPWIAQNAARTLLQLGTNMDGKADMTMIVNFGSMPEPALPDAEEETLPASGRVE